MFDVLCSYWLAGLVIVSFWGYLYEKQIELSFKTVFLWAVAFRIIGIAGSPVLEDDFYRYLLDGCVFVSSGTPYGIPPSTLFGGNSLSPECQYVLNWVNNPDLPTIYGPVLQYIFAFSHLIAPTDIDLLQGILVIFDLGLIFLLGKATHTRNLLLYAWCPLVVKEIAFTAHPDVIGALLLFGAFFLHSQGKSLTACILAGLACCAKVFALVALPFFLFRKSLAHWVATISVMLLLYLPFLAQGNTDMLVLGIFVRDWKFNAIGFELAQLLLPDKVARLVCLILFVSWWCYYFYQYQSSKTNAIPHMDWIYGMFFLLCPVINPWYLVWLLPYAALRPSYWAWTASMVVSLSYINGLNLMESNLAAYEIDMRMYQLEIIAIAAALFLDYRAGRFDFSTLNTGLTKKRQPQSPK